MKHILYVEDEGYISENRKDELEVNGYSVILCRDGREAVQLIEDGIKYHLALIDLSLPEITGEEVVRVSKTINPQTPVITTSCYMYGPKGSDKHVKKPVTGKRFIETVNSFFDE